MALPFEDLTLGELYKGRERPQLDTCKEGVMIIAGNMYYDNKLSNNECNAITGAIIQIRDILDKAEARKGYSC